MTSSSHYTRHKLASLLVVLAFALSFAMPAYAEDAAYESAYVLEDEAVEESQEGATELETAHNTGCMPNLTIDNPTNGSTVQGAGLVWGWGFDAAHTGLGSGMDVFDLYRGDTFIATAAAGASRDPGNVRSDVDSALGKSDMRAGYIFRVDWSTQPGGNQTYRVLGRTGCEWTERTFSVNVNPAPPAPAANLSINDESRTIGTTSSSTGIGSNVVCISTFPDGRCSAYSTQNVGTGLCISRDAFGNCLSYGSSGIYGSTASEVNFDFIVTLSPATTEQVQVDYATADGSAVQGTDYQQTSGTLTFAAGETSKTITVRVYNRGGIYTGTRDFTVRLTNARNAGISDGDGRGTIRGGTTTTGCVSYDAAGNCLSYGSGTIGIGTNCPIGTFWNGSFCQSTTGTGFGSGISINDATCTEPATASTTCTFTIQTNQSSSLAQSGTWSTANGTALGSSACTAGNPSNDFITATGTWTINPFGTSATTNPIVTICGGDTAEGQEAFTVSIVLTSGNVTVVRPTATGTIPLSTT